MGNHPCGGPIAAGGGGGGSGTRPPASGNRFGALAGSNDDRQQPRGCVGIARKRGGCLLEINMCVCVGAAGCAGGMWGLGHAIDLHACMHACGTPFNCLVGAVAAARRMAASGLASSSSSSNIKIRARGRRGRVAGGTGGRLCAMHTERPWWPFSCYAHQRDGANDLLGDFSFEEVVCCSSASLLLLGVEPPAAELLSLLRLSRRSKASP